jgi:hypothetical protein
VTGILWTDEPTDPLAIRVTVHALLQWEMRANGYGALTDGELNGQLALLRSRKRMSWEEVTLHNLEIESRRRKAGGGILPGGPRGEWARFAFPYLFRGPNQ